jgi:anaerobic selenocysteine-containing dehydrogenase
MSPGVEPDVDVRADDESADEEGPGELEALEDEVSPEDVSVSVAVPVGNRRPGLVRFAPGDWTGSGSLPPVDESSFRLVVRRRLYNHGTLVQSAGSLAPLAGSQELRLAPHAMSQLGVAPGDEVRVSTSRGELMVAAVGDGGVPSGVALLQFNAVPADETGASALIDCSVGVVALEVEKVI